MSTSLQLFLLLLSIFADSIDGLGLGINYGRVADNLPDPPRVAALLKSIGITRIRIYDAEPTVLAAFANTNIETTVNVRNEELVALADPAQAQAWVQQKVQPFIPQTKITSITIGNEILSGTDTAMKTNLLPAMRSVYGALQALGLQNSISVSTAHAYGIMDNSYPPSAGSFKQEYSELLAGMLAFHAETKSPFLVNAYPFFAYESDDKIPLALALFEPNPGYNDPGTNLHYDNMLYAQIDAVYAAMKLLGFADVPIRLSETGWPSAGDADEKGATMQNAALYNGNLISRVRQNQGTPAKPNVPLDVFMFALFNENHKEGKLSERNLGLYYPNAVPVYNCGLGPGGARPRVPGKDKDKDNYSSFSSSSTNAATSLLALLSIVPLVSLIF